MKCNNVTNSMNQIVPIVQSIETLEQKHNLTSTLIQTTNGHL